MDARRGSIPKRIAIQPTDVRVGAHRNLNNMKFRKRPVVIEAQQWWPPEDDRHDPSMLTVPSVAEGRYLQVGDLYCGIKGGIGMGPAVYFIKTLEGDMRVSPGDWIITGVKGERYPCKPDIFEATYEPAE